MRSYDFKHDLQNERYEQVFADWLKRIGRTNVEISEGYFPDWDVRADGITYEVKRDYWYKQTGNLLVERYFNKEQQKEGWIEYSKADYLVVFINENSFYMLEMEQVRFKFKYCQIWTVKEITQKEGFTTVNYVAPLTDFSVRWYDVKN